MITEGQVLDIVREAIFLMLKVSAPMLLISLIVGLIISIFQTVTSIQEQTLTFVPKVLSIFIAIIVFGSWMLKELSGYMIELWSDFSIYI